MRSNTFEATSVCGSGSSREAVHLSRCLTDNMSKMVSWLDLCVVLGKPAANVELHVSLRQIKLPSKSRPNTCSTILYFAFKIARCVDSCMLQVGHVTKLRAKAEPKIGNTCSTYAKQRERCKICNNFHARQQKKTKTKYKVKSVQRSAYDEIASTLAKVGTRKIWIVGKWYDFC